METMFHVLLQTHNQYPKEYRDLHIRDVVSCEDISLLEPIDPSKQSLIRK